MILQAVLARDEVIALIARLLPVTIDLGEEGRTLRIDRATAVALVADQGIRIDSSAELDWPIAGVATHVTVPSMTILLRLAVAKRGESAVLAILPSIENADIRHVPGLLEPAILAAINVAIERKPVAWDFSTALGHRFHTPALLGGLSAISTRVAWGKHEITESFLRLELAIEVEAERSV
jgi:hypothetical protein